MSEAKGFPLTALRVMAMVARRVEPRAGHKRWAWGRGRTAELVPAAWTWPHRVSGPLTRAWELRVSEAPWNPNVEAVGKVHPASPQSEC